MRIYAVARPELPPFEMPDRFRTQIVYFMTPSGEHGAPPLGPGEYWVRREDAKQWLEDLVFSIVSPLDAENTTEIELTDEQEAWLEWLVKHDLQHVRVQ